uniref:Endothelin-converting enzyme 1 n=1 Tax=Plectus sambesii TaxID=2011161 RepID=A0A914UNG5_9BILA
MAPDSLIATPHESDKLCAPVEGFKNGDHGAAPQSDYKWAFCCKSVALFQSNNRRHSAMAKITVKSLAIICAALSILCLCLIGALIYFIVMMDEGGDPGHHGPPPPDSGTSPSWSIAPSSISSSPPPASSSTGAPDTSQACYNINNSPGYQEAAKNILGSIDFSADPCQDFYQYACGVWPLKNPLPSDRSKWSIYSAVSQQVSNNIQVAISQINASTTVSEGLKKVKTIYDSCTNASFIEKTKGQALAQLLKGIVETPYMTAFVNGEGRWPIIDELWSADNWKPEAIMGKLKRDFGIDTTLFAYADTADLMSNTTVLLITGQMLPLGLGIFKSKYYLNPSYNQIMQAYQNLTETTAILLARDGNTVPQVQKQDLDDMLNFEKKIANLILQSMSENNVYMWNMSRLQTEIPDFNWAVFLENLLPPETYQQIQQNTNVIQVATPQFVKNMVALIRTTPPRAVQNYLIWRLVKYSLTFLSQEYLDAQQVLNAVMTGKQDVSSREDICLSYIRGRYDLPNLGYATGEAFVGQFFPSTAKADATLLASNVKAALTEMIQELDWMDAQTKTEALRKAQLMRANIAYPDWLMNSTAEALYYANLHLPATASIGTLNLIQRAWAVQENFRSLFRPVAKDAFGGPPVATDAWYSANRNALTVPAGELQKPFFSSDYPKAVIYGAAGAVTGHEMSHGYDQTGSYYDADGNLNNWWTKQSKAAFDNRTACLINQFNNYCYPDLGCVNGAATVTENSADLAGLKAAYFAYQNEQTGVEADRLPNMPSVTDDQVFFLSFASFWCGSETNASLSDQLLTNPHTPDRFRVIGTLRNMPQFAKAFNCPANSYMNPSDRCSIW